MKVLDETLALLREARRKSDAALVSYSGGKDSLVVLDLCARLFARVELFSMYFVPGLRCFEDPIVEVAARYGAPVHWYPHWAALRAHKAGIFCFNGPETDDWPWYKLRDLYGAVIEETKIPIIATGAKRTDSLWRKRNLDSTKGWDEVVTPIVGWSRHEVVAYLVSRSIPLPKGDSTDNSGIDLSRPSLRWLHRNHPEDFNRLCEFFPFARAEIERDRIYGEG